MENRPLVSVVTPSFNQAQFIEETLRSVALQEYRPLHQIVIDGGSTDGTVELLRAWERADHGPGYSFEWISERDRGHADALNKGFDRVRGEIVGWLNSDDVYFDRQVVSTSVAAFEARSDVDVVHGDVALISESSGLQMIWCFPEFNYKRALRGFIIPQPTVFFRRKVTDRHRLDASLKYAIDHVYWLQIGREHKFLKIPRVQGGDRDHGARISQVNRDTMNEVSRQAGLAHGATEKPGRFGKMRDTGWRIIFRFRGLMHLLSIVTRRGWEQRLAFSVWLDSIPKAVKRQLTMRIHKRLDLGPRPSRPAGQRYVTD
jgi:glycosyltransferase involved in cell wall biosynthesis